MMSTKCFKLQHIIFTNQPNNKLDCFSKLFIHLYLYNIKTIIELLLKSFI